MWWWCGVVEETHNLLFAVSPFLLFWIVLREGPRRCRPKAIDHSWYELYEGHGFFIGTSLSLLEDGDLIYWSSRAQCTLALRLSGRYVIASCFCGSRGKEGSKLNVFQGKDRQWHKLRSLWWWIVIVKECTIFFLLFLPLSLLNTRCKPKTQGFCWQGTHFRSKAY